MSGTSGYVDTEDADPGLAAQFAALHAVLAFGWVSRNAESSKEFGEIATVGSKPRAVRHAAGPKNGQVNGKRLRSPDARPRHRQVPSHDFGVRQLVVGGLSGHACASGAYLNAAQIHEFLDRRRA